MRILKHGKWPIADPTRPWIYEQAIDCPRCETQFQFEEGDVFLLSRSLTDPTAAVKCPTCGEAFEVRPAKR